MMRANAKEDSMIDDMGIFRTTIAIEHPAARGEVRHVGHVMVDTGSEYTWVNGALLEELGIQPERTMRFSLADGSIIERPIGFAIVHAGGTSAPDIVVFGGPADKTLLGARSLEGLNLRLDLVRKELVPAGPVEAAASAA
jgi:predicted aspartyl protease